MNSKANIAKGERSLWNFKIEKNPDLKPGDVVKVVDTDGKVLEFGYITNELVYVDGLPVAQITLQRTLSKIEMVVTNAIQKI